MNRIVLLIVFLVLAPVWASLAQAHDWYSSRRDPVYNWTTCCGGHDCAPIPPHAIRDSPDGNLRVVLTLEEAKRINPCRDEPFDEIIPFERIQDSEDGQPHICLMCRNSDARQGFYCAFLSPNG